MVRPRFANHRAGQRSVDAFDQLAGREQACLNVESLLAAHQDAGTFLQAPAVEVAAREGSATNVRLIHQWALLRLARRPQGYIFVTLRVKIFVFGNATPI